MFKSIRVIRQYYKLANIKRIFVALEFFTLMIPAAASIYSAVLSANVISSITVFDFTEAIRQLSFNFVLIVVSAISYFVYHLLSKKVNRELAINLNKYIYTNVRQNENVGKINLSTITGINTLIDFNKNLLYKLCFLIKSITIICIVLYYSPLVGLCLVLVSLVMGVLLGFTDKKIQKEEKEYSEFQANSLVLFNSIQKGSKIEENENLENRLKDKYFNLVTNGAKTKNKIAFFYNLNNNFISLVLKSAVFGLTIYLILLVKSTALTLSLYLILTPYLTNSAQNLIEFFGLFSEVGLVDNTMAEFDALRFRSKESFEPPQKELDIDTFNLYFYHTSLECNLQNKAQKNRTQNTDEIVDVNIKIEYGDIIAFVGEETSGIKAIYKLLSREEASTGGSVFLDYKNIAEIPLDQYKKLIFTAGTNTYFYNISILENFLLFDSSKSKVIMVLKTFGLYSDIEKLKNKINTVVDENFNPKLMYFLGIARAYISGAKIICIYGTPDHMTRTDCAKLLHIMKILKGKCTVICFAHTDIFAPVTNKNYYVEDKKITNQINIKK